MIKNPLTRSQRFSIKFYETVFQSSGPALRLAHEPGGYRVCVWNDRTCIRCVMRHRVDVVDRARAVDLEIYFAIAFADGSVPQMIAKTA